MLVFENLIKILIMASFILCLLFMIVWCFIAVAQIGKQNKHDEIDNDKQQDYES